MTSLVVAVPLGDTAIRFAGPVKVLVCGDRNWSDMRIIARELAALPRGSTIIHGDCHGADKIAGNLSESLGLKVQVFAADWEAHGQAAGPIRNAVMLAARPALVLAFHPNLAASRGTRDMVTQALAAKVPVKLITGGDA